MGQLFNKFLNQKPDVNWTGNSFPVKDFTYDTAVMVNDIDIMNINEAFNLHCEIFIHPGKYFTGATSAFAFQKDFPLKEVIDYNLLRFHQSGLLEQLANKYFKKPAHDCLPPVRELDFKATIFSFAILATGIATAIIVFLVEKIRFIIFNK